MKDTLVSIRMPEGLAKDLEQQSQQEHFLDLSEFIRSVVRKEWLRQTNPQLAELQSLRKKVEDELTKVTEERIHKEVSHELKKIYEQLKKGDGK
jgi:Arc/MetJ-type ribon-helix-helix transcriptional regulator